MKITSRKIHRWLSVVIGMQLLMWTISGLVFSWSPIGEVRGEHRIRSRKAIDLASYELLDSREILSSAKYVPENHSVTGLALKQMLGKPVFELRLDGPSTSYVLVDAVSGRCLSPISKSLAEDIALDDFSEPVQVLRCDYLDQPQTGHSEYRSKEIPVWKVTLDHPSGTAIYVSANRGEVVTRRNDRWRLFDFFWMLHTMDYQGRDNFNSWLLKVMSLFGLFSVFTGYWLWLKMNRNKIRGLFRIRRETKEDRR